MADSAGQYDTMKESTFAWAQAIWEGGAMAKQKRQGHDNEEQSRYDWHKLINFSNLMKLPATLGTLRAFFDAVNWNAAEKEVRDELKRKIVIAGVANTGKSTLFNKIQGRYRSEVSPVAGTTLNPIRGTFGPFVLVDTPGHLPDVQEENAQNATAILQLIDVTQGLRPADRELFARLKKTKRPLIVALNKIDTLKTDPEVIAAGIAAQLDVDDVIPISGKTGANVAEDLIPALIEASPEAALAIGRQLPSFRRVAAERLVRNAALVSLAAGLEPVPLVDIPIILGNQIRMVLRLAALYGEPLSGQYIRELITAIAGGLLMRYLAEEASKAVPFGGDLLSGAIAAGGTWAMGRVATEYFESGKRLDRGQLREMFDQLYARFRHFQNPNDAVRQLAGG